MTKKQTIPENTEKQILSDEALIELDEDIPSDEKVRTLVAFYSNQDRQAVILNGRCRKIKEEYFLEVTPEQLKNLILFFWAEKPELQPSREQMSRENEHNEALYFNPMDLQNLKDRTLKRSKKRNHNVVTKK